MKLIHLVRRACTSFSNREPGPDGLRSARAVLLDGELDLWRAMQPRDMRHSLEVLGRFVQLVPGSSRAEQAAALLHDVGKTRSDLGWSGRVLATLVGARGRRFTDYHDHESIGAAILRGVSESRTIELVASTVDDAVSRALAAADDI